MARKRTRQWYVAFENSFWESEALNLTQKALVAILATWISRDMKCCPTIPQLCKKSALSPKTLYYHLQTLRAKGFIRWEDWRDSKKQSRRLFTLLPTCQIYMRGYGPTRMYFRHVEIKEESSSVVQESPAVIPFPQPIALKG